VTSSEPLREGKSVEGRRSKSVKGEANLERGRRNEPNKEGRFGEGVGGGVKEKKIAYPYP